jgi:hypothetical protein
MAEVGTGLTALAIALGGKELFVKMLGPTAEYLGEQGKDYSQKKIENLSKIFTSAKKYLGPKLEEENSGIPPRVFKEVIDNGSFCEDEICAEYYGGVLASSRSGVPRDDRAIVMLDLIKSLSTYQTRAHYIFYQILRTIFLGSSNEINSEPSSFTLYIPSQVFFDAFLLEEGEDYDAICRHSIVGLGNKGLIKDDFLGGSKDFLSARYPKSSENFNSDGFIITPTIMGVQLFLWANALSKENENNFISNDLNIKQLSNVSILDGSISLKPPKFS